MKFRILLVSYSAALFVAFFWLSEGLMWWVSLSATLFFLTLLLYGVTTLKFNFFLHSVSHPPEGTVVLSFDDGPDPVNTPKVLAILKKHQVKAIFFLIGHKVTQYPQLVKQIQTEGHLIGNHSDAHDLSFTFKGTSDVEQDLARANRKLNELTGLKIKYVRPPFGITNPNIARAIQNLGMISIGWNVRPKDTNYTDSEKLLKVLQRKTKQGGALILLHDRVNATTEILEEYILFCKKKGMKFGTLKTP